MLRRCLGSQTCAAAQWARGSRTHLQRLLLRLEASAKFGALPHLWNINGDTCSTGRLSALGRRLDVVHWVVDLAAGHREPQHHVGKRDPIWPAISGAVPSDVLAVSCLPSHLCFLSTWAAPVLAREFSLGAGSTRLQLNKIRGAMANDTQRGAGIRAEMDTCNANLMTLILAMVGDIKTTTIRTI